MTLRNKKLIMCYFSFALIITLLFGAITPAYATDNVNSLEQSTSDLENELSELNNKLDELSKEVSSISKKIKNTTARIEDTKAELAIAKGEEEAQYAAMKTRIQYMYENGNADLLETLLTSASMADFLYRAEMFSAIQEYDRKALQKLKNTREAIAEREAELAQEQENLIALKDDLSEKEKAISSQINTTSSQLTSYKEKLKKAKEDAKKAEEALKQQVKPVKPAKPTSGSSGSFRPNLDTKPSASDIEIFAALIECEAGSSNYEGMLAVASVVVNRMKHSRYPDTLYGVIYQPGQFPPATDGKVDRVLTRGIKDSCLQVAQEALAGKNNVGDCLSFRSASSGYEGTIIGSNVFF